MRLTGSGLGCSSWPKCETYQFVPESDFHAWVEFGNRLFTGAVSVAVVLAVLGARRLIEARPDLLRLAWGLVVGVLAQIIIGAVAVKTELLPGVVAVHFLVSMLLIVNALVLHHRAGSSSPEEQAPRNIRQLAWTLLVATGVVTLLGTAVTAAGPHAGDEEAERLDVPLENIAKVHGISVIFLVAITGYLVWKLSNGSLRDSALSRAAKVFAGIIAAQAVVGYTQYFNDIPAALVAVHIAGATLAVLAATQITLLATAKQRVTP